MCSFAAPSVTSLLYWCAGVVHPPRPWRALHSRLGPGDVTHFARAVFSSCSWLASAGRCGAFASFPLWCSCAFTSRATPLFSSRAFSLVGAGGAPGGTCPLLFPPALACPLQDLCTLGCTYPNLAPDPRCPPLFHPSSSHAPCRPASLCCVFSAPSPSPHLVLLLA